MKKIFASFVLLCLMTKAYSQETTQLPVSCYFKKEIPVDAISGKSYRFEMAVHSNNASPLHAIQVISETRDSAGELRSNLMEVEWRREQDWEIATVSGRILSGIQTLTINTLLNSKGEFYFDDINLYVEDNPGKWRQVSLFNSSFEQVEGVEIPGYSFSYSSRKKISRQVAKVGRQSLRINLTRSSENNNVSVSN